ncbi:hypothetical protein KJ644_04485 [Candidatus Dependentiae bacterium]|nr:hypothetical protein [Candidatus Dependentiae bacterium]MBU4387697.1 hypothetical protein [Candidatus Dependentiae bacterium]MCG2756599.1 hypothetical protein [Candidatus Dependentiae bacterium]
MNIKRILFIFYTITIYLSTIFATDKINVENASHDPIFVSIYYQKGDMAERFGFPEIINPQDNINLNRPPRTLMSNRLLIFSYNKEDLKKSLSGKNYLDSTKIKIGNMHGNKFHIVEHSENLKGYNSIEWNLLNPIQKLLGKTLDVISNEIRNRVNSGKHANETALVRLGNDLCSKEIEYLKNRKAIIKSNIEKFIGSTIDKENIPNIAFCCSGGGYRAMIGTAGLFSGAEKIGLLDCATYAAGLSGSTWFITPWLYSGKSVSAYNEYLMNIVSTDLKTTFIDPGVLTVYLMEKNIFGQPVTLVDIYGCLIANKLFANLKKYSRQNIFLSAISEKINNGKNIFPLLTAIQSGKPFTWFEFSPYEIGGSFSGAFVPTWAAGRKFLGGKSKDFGPEQSLGFFMGIWGSAFTFSLQQGLDHAQNKIPKSVNNFIQKTLDITGAHEERMSMGKLNNFAYGLNLELGKLDVLKLLDGGLDFNLPFPPLLRKERQTDIIIICDMSASAYKGAGQLKLAEDWARAKKIKFPKIDYANITKEKFSVFKDKTDSTIPTLIYFSLVKNPNFDKQFDPTKEIQTGFCGTMNFKYTNKQFKLLSGLMEQNIIEAKEIIKKEIINKINAKKTLI